MVACPGYMWGHRITVPTYYAGMGGMRASLSPLDCSSSSLASIPSFGILCVGMERGVGVTARSPLACQRPSKAAPMPTFQWARRPMLGAHSPRCKAGQSCHFHFTPSFRSSHVYVWVSDKSYMSMFCLKKFQSRGVQKRETAFL